MPSVRNFASTYRNQLSDFHSSVLLKVSDKNSNSLNIIEIEEYLPECHAVDIDADVFTIRFYRLVCHNTFSTPSRGQEFYRKSCGPKFLH
jgi:hypothetical protein